MQFFFWSVKKIIAATVIRQANGLFGIGDQHGWLCFTESVKACATMQRLVDISDEVNQEPEAPVFGLSSPDTDSRASRTAMQRSMAWMTSFSP